MTKKLLEKERTLEEIVELCKVYEQIGEQSTTMNEVHSTQSICIEQLENIKEFVERFETGDNICEIENRYNEIELN